MSEGGMEQEHRIELRCSFCGKHQREVRKLIAGPTVYICDECIKLCNQIIAEEAKREEPPEQPAPPKAERRAKKRNQTLCCSFCGKSQREVKKLIAGPNVYICDECIGLCNDIIAEEIDLEEISGALRSALPGEGRAFLATIVDRGSGATGRLSNLAHKRDRRFWFLRRLFYRFAMRIPRRVLVSAWRLSDRLSRRTPERVSVLASLGGLSSEWRMLQTLVGMRESLSPAATPHTEVELPAWVRPVADRLTATVEVLETLGPRFDEGRLEESRDSLEHAHAQVRHARDLLMSGPPDPTASS